MTTTTRIALLFAFLAFLPPTAARAADVSAAEFLNAALAHKPDVEYTRATTTTRRVCHRAPGYDPVGMSHEICHDERREVTRRVPGKATVGTTRIVEVRDLVLDKDRIVGLPEKALLAEQEFSNCAAVQMNNSVSLAVSGTRGYQVVKGRTVTTSAGGSVTLSTGPTSWGQAGTTFSFSRAVTVQRSETESHSETVSRSLATTISVPPQTVGRLSLLAYETTIEIPFSATVVVDGELNNNASGLRKASEILSEAERTLPFSGVIRLREVSNSRVSTTPLSNARCAEADQGKLLAEVTAQELPAEALTDYARERYTAAEEVAPRPPAAVAPLRPASTIGPISDGEHYHVLYTSERYRPDPICGFNDIGMPNTALYTVEHREYLRYLNNAVVARWTDTVEVFRQCWSV